MNASQGRDRRRSCAAVLPFRTNEYVIDSLIDWSAAPDDPIYRLAFPQADMLSAAQFVDEPDLKMATGDMARVAGYLQAHQEVTSVLITGGDPMIMGESVLRRYVEPLLGPGLEHFESIRIGTKSLAYWPQRFVTDPDADDTLRLFEEVAAAAWSRPRRLRRDRTASSYGSRAIPAGSGAQRRMAFLLAINAPKAWFSPMSPAAAGSCRLDR